MKHTVIIGGGFAGLSAARRLTKHADRFRITLLDPRAEQQFLPLLPDLIGRALDPLSLRYPLFHAARDMKFSLRQEAVITVQAADRCVNTPTGRINYDYLIIAAGTQTNLHGRSDLAQNAYPLHSVEDALRIRAALHANRWNALVVAGGGYTGVEIATQLWRTQRKNRRPLPIYLVEHGPAICSGLPPEFQEYIAKNLLSLGIQMRTRTGVESVTPERVTLSNGETFERAMPIWTAGVCAPDFVNSLAEPKTKTGCLQVDEYLRVQDTTFAAGDIAAVNRPDGRALRMGIQFSLTQGECAAENIILLDQGRPLQKYRPNDLGYIVPMANGCACGNVLGKNLYGRVPLLLHYAMSVLRSSGWSNRLSVAGQVLRTRHTPETDHD